MFHNDTVLDVAFFSFRHFVIGPGMVHSGRMMLVKLLRFGEVMALTRDSAQRNGH